MDAIMLEMTFPEFLEKKYLEWQLKEVGRKTIIQFAAYIGVSQPILSMWMSGKKRPGTENIRLLAEIFGDEVYDSLSIPRPNPYLRLATENWEFMSEEKQKQISSMIAEEAAKYEAKRSANGVQTVSKREKAK